MKEYFLNVKNLIIEAGLAYTDSVRLILLLDALLQDDDCIANDEVKGKIEDLNEYYGVYSKSFRNEVYNFLAKMNWRAIVSFEVQESSDCLQYICSRYRNDIFSSS